jgi:hypothetical protein
MNKHVPKVSEARQHIQQLQTDRLYYPPRPKRHSGHGSAWEPLFPDLLCCFVRKVFAKVMNHPFRASSDKAPENLVGVLPKTA